MPSFSLDRLLFRFGRRLQNSRYRERLKTTAALLLLVLVVLAVAGFRLRKEFFADPILIAAAVAAIFGGLGFFRYLDSAGDRKTSSILRYRLQELETKLEAREANISKVIKSATGDLIDVSALAKELKDSILTQGSTEVLDDIRARVAKIYEQNALTDSLEAPQKRLEQEIAELRRRSNINLFFGIVLGIGGLAVLGWVAFHETTTAPGASLDFLRTRISRISLGILVEFLAYFFLRLYKAAAAEVRFYHNELTNHESRMMAIELARVRGPEAVINKLIASLLETERNFILTKEQTTAELEGKRLEIQSSEAVIRLLTGIITHLGPSKPRATKKA